MEEAENRPREPEENEEKEAAKEQQPDRPKRAGFAARVLTPKWLLVLLAISIFGHGVGFAYSRWTARPSTTDHGPEVPLGEFRFAGDPAEGGHVSGAEFSLHISLLSQLDQQGRRELETRKFRVQQAIEELIRAAHSADFEDPLLGELKRQLQERINRTLGIRVIADVIITDLELQFSGSEPRSITGTADAQPWTETPSS